MSSKLKKEIIDQTLHVLMGAILVLPFALLDPRIAAVVTAAIAALYREDAQHRPDEGWAWLKHGTWRWIDIGAISTGGLLMGLWIGAG